MTDLFDRFDKRAMFAVLALLMLLSRPYPLSTIVHLADASSAVFFIGGLMLLPAAAFVAFLLLAVAVDAVSIGVFGTSAFCVSPAYAFLLPTYALLWYGGRVLATTTPSLAGSVRLLAGFALLQSAAFVLSSGSFWFLSGRFNNPDLAGFFTHNGQYYAGYLLGGLWYLLFYVAARHAVQLLLNRQQSLN